MIFSKLLGHRNSILLVYDHLSGGEFERMQSEIHEVRSFYRFTKISELVKGALQKKQLGQASILFENPRKSVLLKGVKFCLDQNLPFSIGLRVDCIGLNRLPEDEEIELYRKHYPSQMQTKIFSTETRELNQELLSLRKLVGPLPIAEIDPTQFFCTWGKLVELPESLFEAVVALHTTDFNLVSDGIKIMRQQLGQSPSVGKIQWNRNHLGGEGLKEKPIPKLLENLGLKACVGNATGAVSPESEAFDLPVWRFST